jgi:2-polyprenyl-6-hydroxyphenyl methylase/3-demethylubiquinone-9 3-methyltransferase
MDLSDEYRYRGPDPTWSNNYIWPAIKKILKDRHRGPKKLFEIGCGNGATANMLEGLGYEVTGIDSSKSGIEIANRSYPNIKLFVGDAYDNLAEKYGTFPVVISLEVIEHCHYPRKFAKTFFDLLEKDGLGIMSTPYHGYWKNIALAVFNKMDRHYSPLWDGGHVKFWSGKTLSALLEETGFKAISFVRVGRIPVFAKSMIAVVRK